MFEQDSKNFQHFSYPPHARQIFCNRTLNLNKVKAIGYDLDYTLVHYKISAWEGAVYTFMVKHLEQTERIPTDTLTFNPESVCRGLVIDTELGNLLKADRFGHVKIAQHGLEKLSYPKIRELYLHNIVTLGNNDRFLLVETLFGLAEACLFAQLVKLFDQQRLTHTSIRSYKDIYQKINVALNLAHATRAVKDQVMKNPADFIELDPLIPQTLLEQRAAGKKVLLVTNSDYIYANAILSYAFQGFLPATYQSWQQLFDLIIVDAAKPQFFTSKFPIYEFVSPNEGLMRPCREGIQKEGIYAGGNAALVENYLKHAGEAILYVGDHIFSDVIVSKTTHEWRTAFIIRELEDEITAYETQNATDIQMEQLMHKKQLLEWQKAQYKACMLRLRSQELGTYPLTPLELNNHGTSFDNTNREILYTQCEKELENIRTSLQQLDAILAPLAEKSGQALNPNWGYIFRTGNEKSLLTQQIERYADLYTSRVSNFLYATPFMYFRAPRAHLAHNP